MRRLFVLVVFILTATTVFSQKKVAVWETQCFDAGFSNLKNIMVRGDLEEVVDNTYGYIKYEYI